MNWSFVVGIAVLCVFALVIAAIFAEVSAFRGRQVTHVRVSLRARGGAVFYDQTFAMKVGQRTTVTLTDSLFHMRASDVESLAITLADESSRVKVVDL